MTPDILPRASDPTADPAWLRATLSDAIGRYASQTTKDPALLEQIRTLVRNPALPLPVLGQVLLWPMKSYSVEAWHNPSVPLLLMGEPLVAYRDASWRLLAHLCPRPPAESTLPRLLRYWEEQWWPLSQRIDRDSPEVRAGMFAERIAHLFGLPWAPWAPPG